jgi:hypothetical protein
MTKNKLVIGTTKVVPCYKSSKAEFGTPEGGLHPIAMHT